MFESDQSSDILNTRGGLSDSATGGVQGMTPPAGPRLFGCIVRHDDGETVTLVANSRELLTQRVVLEYCLPNLVAVADRASRQRIRASAAAGAYKDALDAFIDATGSTTRRKGSVTSSVGPRPAHDQVIGGTLRMSAVLRGIRDRLFGRHPAQPHGGAPGQGGPTHPRPGPAHRSR
jgi:hypothetical protein